MTGFVHHTLFRYTKKFRCILFFLAGICVASCVWYLHQISILEEISGEIKPYRQKNNPYHFISPLLSYEVPASIKEFQEYKFLQQKLNAVLEQQKLNGLENAGVYFRDLSLGKWTGINENIPFAPASMMKVVLMIAYFKEAENNPEILSQQWKYSRDVDHEIQAVPFQTASRLEVGKIYTVNELIHDMIINSDNGSKNLLLDHVDQDNLNEVYTDLGLPNPDTNPNNYTISAKQYSLLLRVLYNGTYLSRKYSEMALQIMSQATFREGIIDGLPKNNILVAQKFGESIDASNPRFLDITLSNCGIIYHPTHPYVLCAMTTGKDLTVLEKTISSLSGVAWSAVDSYVNF